RQLASRARRRVHGAAATSDADLARQQEVVDAFLAASRGGDFDALLALLDPDVTLRADAAVMPEGAPRHVRGALAVARGARAFSERANSRSRRWSTAPLESSWRRADDDRARFRDQARKNRRDRRHCRSRAPSAGRTGGA